MAALVPDFRVDTVTADGVSSIINDYTVYGGAAVLRNTVAVGITAYKVDEDLAETAMAIATYDPEVASSFTVTNTIDGWVKYKVAIANYWLIGTTYSLYNAVWSPTLNAYYKYINITPSSGHLVTETLYWLPVSDITSLIDNVGTATESTNLVYQVVNTIFRYNAEKCYIKMATKVAKEKCLDPCGPISALNNVFIRVDGLLNASIIDDIDQTYIAGERAMRTAENYCDDCGCGCNSD